MRINGLSFAYGSFPVFDEFSFEAGPAIILLRGPSGCGKSTLLKLIAGHLQPMAISTWDIPADVRLILQEDALFPWLTGLANIQVAYRDSPLNPQTLESHAMFDICKDFIRKPAAQMSFGQRRLIELFRSFLSPPQMLCLDEPFNFLDPANREKVARIIMASVAKSTQVVISSHYSEDDDLYRAQIFSFDGLFPIRSLTPLP